MVTFDGKQDEDRALWQTYVYWVRERLRIPSNPNVIADNPIRRLPESTSQALQVVLFSAFALEYRVKSVLTYCSASLKPEEHLKSILRTFWQRLLTTQRIDGAGLVVEPPEWAAVVSRLLELADVRNKIAHANRAEILAFINEGSDPLSRARGLFEAAIDGIRIINEGTGYDSEPHDELVARFDLLKV